MPRRLPPPGCITATEAIKRVGKTLYRYVEKGEVHPQGPTTLRHRFYLESEIARIEQVERSAFEGKLQKVPARFEQARSSDMQSLYQLAIRIFGGSTISPEKRAAWIEAEPRGNYVLKRPDTHEVVSYFYLQSLSHERTMQYMRECKGSTIQPQELRKIEPGTSHELIIAGIGTDPRASKQYTGALLHGVAQDLAEWGKEGIEITKLFAYSETVSGIYLSFSMGMELWKRPRYIKLPEDDKPYGPFFTFVLDVKKTDIPLLRPYRRALTEYRQSHQDAQETPVAIAPPVRRKAPVETHTDALERSELPEGLVGLAEYAKQMGIPETTLKKAVLSGRVPVVRGHWKKGKAIVQQALDEAGRARVQELYGKKQAGLFDE